MVNQLGAFINQVEAFRGKKLTVAQADELISDAQNIIQIIHEIQGAAKPVLSSETVIELPKDFGLSQNSPNPFNPTTTIQYAIPAGKGGLVRLTIYDSRGSLVRTLVDGEQNSGMHSATWNATDDAGRRISSGIYIYQLEVGSFTQTRKMLLMR
ncbi:MAG: FlgD immunoglobulin-like domain containing protein [Candidatus Latescibacter sp.]|nr:FlgD immunoglobulin-like domain containing protein [Candidatus Latescibacter sp.]